MPMMKLLALVPFLFACGGGTVDGSCDSQSLNGACIEYMGPSDVVTTYKNNCAPGTWTDGPCTATNRVGGCRSTDNGLKLTYTTWFYPPNTTSSVMQSCGAATFTP